MNRRVNLFILLMTVAVTAFAEDNRTVAANLEKDLSLPKKNIILPPLITEKYEYHEICGCSEKDLHCDLTQKAIRCDDGKKYDSVTKWKVTWDYDYNRSAQTCFADSFRLMVDIIVHLPKWVSMGDAPQFLVDKWDSYIANLTLHENGHRDRVLDAATELVQAVAELPPARTCADLDRKVQTLCRVRMQKLVEEQKEYDTITKHGHAQGVSFP